VDDEVYLDLAAFLVEAPDGVGAVGLGGLAIGIEEELDPGNWDPSTQRSRTVGRNWSCFHA
jgi:hypothetical protein